MPYIVKSSLDIGGKVVPWNEQETKKLIKEKEEFLSKKETPNEPEKIKDVKDYEEQKENKAKNKKTQKVGE